MPTNSKTKTTPQPEEPQVENIAFYRLHDLKFWDLNYHKGDVPRVKESFLTFGYNGVLRVWRDNVVYAGNTSLAALLELFTENPKKPPIKIRLTDDGLEWLVPSDDITHLTRPKAEAFAIADNNTVARGFIDEAKLADLLIELSANDQSGFKGTGYSQEELNTMISESQRAANIGGADSPVGTRPEEQENTYLNGTTKQIVLYYEVSEYKIIVDKLQRIGDQLGIDNNTDIITKLIEYFEQGETHAVED